MAGMAGRKNNIGLGAEVWFGGGMTHLEGPDIDGRIILK